MSTLVEVGPVVVPVLCPSARDYANRAARCVLDAEIIMMQARLAQRSENAATACGLMRGELDRQLGWLRDGLAKLEARRDALC